MVFPNGIQKDMRKTEMLHVFLSSYLLGESADRYRRFAPISLS